METQKLLDLANEALKEKGFFTGFTKEEEEEGNRLAKIQVNLNPQNKDLRSYPWISIDNKETRDFDQLTYAEKLPNNGYKIFVAIADVDTHVKKNSILDRFAQHNTISVYTPIKVFTMLPEKLSYDLTSLIEFADRYALIVESDINSEGKIVKYDTYLAIVQNKAKLNYNELGDWLENKGPIPEKLEKNGLIKEQAILQDQIATKLRQYRDKQGSLLFDIPEPQPIVRDDRVVDIQVTRENRARDLIEDFMICANRSIAFFLRERKIPSLRRVVRIPKRWDRIRILAQKYGYQLPENPDSKLLQAFLIERQAKDPATFADLSLAVIKLLGKGEYVVEIPGTTPLGHFNLSIQDYTHTTAPNRRFTDLITQRILKSIFSNTSLPYSLDDLEYFATKCTEKDDDAVKIERKMKKSATILFLANKLGETFNAIVTGVTKNGTWVRAYHPLSEGKLVQGYANVDVGDRITVRLLNVDFEKGFIDFGLVD